MRYVLHVYVYTYITLHTADLCELVHFC